MRILKSSLIIKRNLLSFAIWLQEKGTGRVQTIYVTGKAVKRNWRRGLSATTVQ
ncbi:MAG: hypothetical protein PVG35_18350 [Desulfobacterales bacterium]|jgi:hypothetical protein